MEAGCVALTFDVEMLQFLGSVVQIQLLTGSCRWPGTTYDPKRMPRLTAR